MDIRHMRQLLAIRSHGSVAKAAQALGMSQPTLSAAMTRLEDQLGVKLLHRRATGAELTPLGELIAQRASKVLAETEAMLRDAELVASGEAGVLRLGVGTALRPNFLPEFVRSLAEAYPDLRLHVQVLDRDKLMPMLKDRELDLVVCAVGAEASDERFVVTPVMAAKVVAVARPEHPLATGGHLRVARFVDLPSGGASVLGYMNAELLAVRECDSAVSHYIANDYDPLLALARSGVCTLLAPYHVVQPEIEAGSLSQLNLDWDLTVAFAAITTRASNYSPIVKRAMDCAIEVGKRLGGGVAG